MGIAGGGDCSSRTCWVHFATWTLLWMQRWLTGCLPPRPLLMNWLGHPAPSICPHPQAPLYWFITTRTHSALPLSPRSCSIVYVMFWQNEKSEVKNNSWPLRIRQVVPPMGKGLTLGTDLTCICRCRNCRFSFTIKILIYCNTMIFWYLNSAFNSELDENYYNIINVTWYRVKATPPENWENFCAGI